MQQPANGTSANSDSSEAASSGAHTLLNPESGQSSTGSTDVTSSSDIMKIAKEGGLSVDQVTAVIRMFTESGGQGPTPFMLASLFQSQLSSLLPSSSPRSAALKLHALLILPLSTRIVHSFFYLLQLPQLSDPYSFLNRHIWALLPSLPPPLRHLFIHTAASAMPEEHLRSEMSRWVECCQTCLTSRLQTFGGMEDSFVRGCIRSLGLLHDLNELVHKRAMKKHTMDAAMGADAALQLPPQPPVARSAFINDYLSSRVDLSRDFLRWQRQQKRERRKQAAKWKSHTNATTGINAIGNGNGNGNRRVGTGTGNGTGTVTDDVSAMIEHGEEFVRVMTRPQTQQMEEAEEKKEETEESRPSKRQRTEAASQSDGANGAVAGASSATTAATSPSGATTAAAGAAAPSSLTTTTVAATPPPNPNLIRVISPRHFHITAYPFLLDAASLSRIVLSASSHEQQRLADGDDDHDHAPRIVMGGGVMMPLFHHHHSHGNLHLHVRRKFIVQDTLARIQRLTSRDLKRPLRVQFDQEQGLDYGGVKREFFSLLMRNLFDPSYNMFLEEEEQYVINPTSLWQPEEMLTGGAEEGSASSSSSPSSSSSELSAEAKSTLAEYELVGIVIGLSIFNSCQLDLRFPKVFYSKLLAYVKYIVPWSEGSGMEDERSIGLPLTPPNLSYTLADLSDSHPQLSHGLQQLLRYPAKDSEEFAATFPGLTFTIDHAFFGTIVTRELVPGGRELNVTLENRAAYVKAYVDYILNTSISRQFRALACGFLRVVNRETIRLLHSPEELELILCGGKHQSMNISDLEAGAQYDGWPSYRPSEFSTSGHQHQHIVGPTKRRPTHPVIDHFWEVVHESSREFQLKLLAFVTGSNRLPIKGLKYLKFVIQHGGDHTDRLPEAHTCFNQLVLQCWKDKKTLREKLYLAVNEGGEGFQLK